MSEPKPLIAIVGPTASGKTSIAVAIARTLDGEIISGDSRQVYIGMDIGTGKDLSDYGTDVPYHLIDIVPAGTKYNLYRYLRDSRQALEDIRSRGRQPIVCGGTGMYVEALLNGTALPEVPVNPDLRERLKDKSLDELTEMLAAMKRLHNTTDVDTAARAIRAIEIEEFYRSNPEAEAVARPSSGAREQAVIFCVDIPRDERRRRISERLRHRLEQENMVDEVRRLLDSGIDPESLIYYGLEYKYLTLHVVGQLTYDEMYVQLETAIHQFAKRQMTWFRGMERRGFTLNYIPFDMSAADIVDTVRKHLS